MNPTQSAPGWMLYPVRSEQIKSAGSDDVDHAEWVIRADGPPPPRPVKAVPASELERAVEALEEIRRVVAIEDSDDVDPRLQYQQVKRVQEIVATALRGR